MLRAGATATAKESRPPGIATAAAHEQESASLLTDSTSVDVSGNAAGSNEVSMSTKENNSKQGSRTTSDTNVHDGAKTKSKGSSPYKVYV